ncbi:MAG: MATE family efflux transporter [Clostridia bacterium]|nr:MATE family efflux transporter [Clostridia bacterium]
MKRVDRRQPGIERPARRTPAFTEGHLLGKIFVFAFPLLFTNLLQILYNATDMIVVGRFSSVQGAVGAIGSTGALINLLLNLLFGVAVGANVVVANAIGARDEERCRRAVHTSLSVGVMCGLIGCAVGLLFCRPLLIWMEADPALLDMSVAYTRIYFLGVPFSAVLNYAVAVLRAKGDTKTPFFVLSAAGVLNVLLNIFFVAGLGMDVDGVATATALSTALSTVVILVKMSRDDDWCRLEWRRLLRPHLRTARRILFIGIPAGIQGTLFSLSNVFIQRAVNGFGAAVIEANSISSNIEGLAYTSVNSITQAAITVGGQNMGARRYDRMGRIIRDCLFAALAVGAVMSAALYLARHPLISLYMSPSTAERDAILAAAELRFKIVMAPYAILAVMDVGSGILRGLGCSTSAMVITLIGACAFRILWIYTFFAARPELWVLFVSLPISWALTGGVLLLRAIWFRHRTLKAVKNAVPGDQPATV